MELAKAHAAIRELESIARKQKKILEKIPPELLKEIRTAEKGGR